MHQSKVAVAVLSAIILIGCGGGGSSGGSQSTAIKFSRQVSFGDSLSDVGTYAVGAVAALGGGKYTVNSVPASAQNWTELMAVSLGLPAPCPAQTGLDGYSQAILASQPTLAALAPLSSSGFAVATVNNAGCYGYGQGGARVTSQPGIGNAALGGANAVLGQLTLPIVDQITNHLNAVGGKFSGTEVVYMLAGANDVLFQLETVSAEATAAVTAAVTAQVNSDVAGGTCTPTDSTASNCVAQAQGELWQASLGSSAAVTAAVTAQVTADVTAGTCTPTNAQATNCTAQAETELVTAYLTSLGNNYVQTTAGPAAVKAMVQAATELSGYINNMIIANGANYVVVVNIPDLGTTPFGNAQTASTLGLINTMVSSFNSTLQAGVSGSSKVLYVDANTQSHLNTQDPSQYGLTNVTATACNLAATANPLSSSLVCSPANVISGDISHYLFADTVHPTPYGYSLLAKYVATQMAIRGWL